MTAKEFATALTGIAPSMQELSQYAQDRNLSANWQNRVRSSYICVLRRNPTAFDYSDQLLDLAGNYDLSSVEVGSVYFPHPPTIANGKAIVGSVAGGPLVVNLLSGEIEELDPADTSFTVDVAAGNGELFLDALWLFAKNTRYFSLGDFDSDRALASECTSAAGGESFQSFWLGMVGQ